jgi:phage terminase large subunit
MSRVQVNQAEQLEQMIVDFYDDRVAFAKEICNMTPDDQQGDMLRALDQHDHVADKAGHSTGKSSGEAICILHYGSTRYPFKIPCTAPSKHQLYDVLWSELALWHKKMNPLFRDMFIWTKENFRLKSDPEECFAAARTATKENPEALQGFHSQYVFRVIDEASAVPDSVMEVLEGATGTVETKELQCGNPTRLEGTFYRAFTKDKEFFKLLTASCLNSQLTPPRYIERMRNKWGEDSNMWKIRVLGEFPDRESDSFIPYHLAYDALIREIPDQKGLPVVFGVDVARYGDDKTAIAIRQGDEFRPVRQYNQLSTMQTAYEVAKLANQMKPKQIFVDVNGLGAGVYDRLQEMGYPVVAVNVSESPAYNPHMYNRLRDELWGNFRDWLEQRRGKIHDNDDMDLIGELTSPKYHLSGGRPNKIVIESKDDMRKRGKESPNMADACIMTFAQPVSYYSEPEEDEFWAQFRQDGGGYNPLDKETGY